MKTKKVFFILSVFALLVVTVLSCQTMAALTGIGAEIAAEAGVIDRNIAREISTAAVAVYNAAEEINPEQEYYIGRAVAANILSRYKLYTGNANLTAYLNRICATITINSPRPDIFNGYHVAILDTNEINAFATPGGHIFVTRGLIAVTKSEDALASVIAHEVSHIQLKHGIKAIKTSRISGALAETGLNAAARTAGMQLNELTDILNEAVTEVVQTLVTNGYSQQQEFEADTMTLSLLASAGYNPPALIEMLQSLPTGGSAGFGKTHPQPAQRITNAQKTVGNHRVADTASRQARFATATR